MKKICRLASCTTMLWALLIYPAWLLGGAMVWIQSLTALFLCLAPALATMAWALHTGFAPERQLTVVLGGSGIRMAFSLGGGLLLYKTMPETFANGFWLWMIVFYMFILAMETILIVWRSEAR
jgi:hypothetical protein